MESKWVLKSKTVWSNLVLALAALYSPASDWFAANPDVLVYFFAGLNTALRLITKDRITLT